MRVSLFALKHLKVPQSRELSPVPADDPYGDTRRALKAFLSAIGPRPLRFQPLIFPPDGRTYYADRVER